MSYKEKPQLKLYKYENSSFVLQTIIDDYKECSFERNIYQAGQFSITINYNIPNASLFQRGLFVQFGNDPYDFGEIKSIADNIDNTGKGSQQRIITGYDSRYILKRRVVKNMNSNGSWVMTAKGEYCLRNLINDQVGANAETKRRLPIVNVIPQESECIGKTYSVSESFTNLYEVCKTIATQSEIGWRIKFQNDTLTLECYLGTNRSQTVRFDTNFESLANGEFNDSSDSYSNTIYIGGKGQNEERDIYEGENLIGGNSPSGFDRFESWDNQSSMNTEDEYRAEANSMLVQYGQTIAVSGNALAKSPYIYKEEYDAGDFITIAFSGKQAVVQILSVQEHWAFGNYGINFSFGKPQNNLADQLQLMLRKIQLASNNTSTIDSVKWYEIPTDYEMPNKDVTCNTLGFTGTIASGGNTFTLYLDEEGTGAKTYNIYVKNLSGNDKLTLTTGVTGAENYLLSAGTYVAQVYVDEEGNIFERALSSTNEVAEGNNAPVTSDAVARAIGGGGGGTLYADTPIGVVQSTFDTTAPEGWLLLQGQTISRTEYSDLFDWANSKGLIGTGAGKPFGPGDGSTTFVLPDCREATLKGTGLTSKSNNHYDSDGLSVGEFINDRIQSHQHYRYPGWRNGWNLAAGEGSPNYGYQASSSTQYDNADFIGEVYSARTGATTETKAIGVNWIIKAKQIPLPIDLETEMENYVRKQNLLSPLEGWGIVGSGMPYDGILYVTAVSDVNQPNFTIMINGTEVARWQYNAPAYTVVSPVCIPFNKGDVITIGGYGSALYSGYVRYYKLRDYSGR